MKIYYDFHIHTALSPCGDEDMTPNNIVNMAKLKGLDAICITDHNSCENTGACIKAGNRAGILVIPGMELQTREDIHVVCMFRSLKDAECFQDYVYSHLPPLKNREDVFGRQVVYDDEDEIVGINEKLLLNSANISFDEAFYRVNDLNGVFIPAHIDKDSFSVISNIGFIPDYLPIGAIEYVDALRIKKLSDKGIINSGYNMLKSSDAHYLGDILERDSYISADKIDIDDIFKSISSKM